MERVNERAAAEAFMEKLTGGVYSVERSKNIEVDYCREKETRDTEAVRRFTGSQLFAKFKEIQ